MAFGQKIRFGLCLLMGFAGLVAQGSTASASGFWFGPAWGFIFGIVLLADVRAVQPNTQNLYAVNPPALKTTKP